MSEAIAAPAAGPVWLRVGRLIQEFGKYFLASAIALGVDFVLLVLLTEYVGLHYLLSAAISFSTGAIVQYALSITLVFQERRIANRKIEFAGFFVIGLLALGVNQVVLWGAVELAGLTYVVGKLVAAGFSFVVNFLIRRALLFTRREAPKSQQAA